jgi:predicted DNA-binding transcriptional regulator AlpA
MQRLNPHAAAAESNGDAAADALLLDARAVARLLGVSAKTATRLAAAGQLPRPIKLGHLTRWSRVALEEWIAARQKGTNGVE